MGVFVRVEATRISYTQMIDVDVWSTSTPLNSLSALHPSATRDPQTSPFSTLALVFILVSESPRSSRRLSLIVLVFLKQHPETLNPIYQAIRFSLRPIISPESHHILSFLRLGLDASVCAGTCLPCTGC